MTTAQVLNDKIYTALIQGPSALRFVLAGLQAAVGRRGADENDAFYTSSHLRIDCAAHVSTGELFCIVG